MAQPLYAVSFSRAVEAGLNEARAFVFRERAVQAHKKAMRAGIPEEIRRAWLIVERDWARMAEREAVKVEDAAWNELEAAAQSTTVTRRHNTSGRS